MKYRYQDLPNNAFKNNEKEKHCFNISEIALHDNEMELKELFGGRLNKVYKYYENGKEKIVKICYGKYRKSELRREVEIINLLNLHTNIAPQIYSYQDFEEYGYMIQEYIGPDSVKEKLQISKNQEERNTIWEKAGGILASIHSKLKQKDENQLWLKNQIEIAQRNMDNRLIDISEFDKETPESVLKWLISNVPKRTELCLIHGDYRTKNILVSDQDTYKVIDWGFVDYGDPYYDLAIIDYYFTNEEDRASFYKGYRRLEYIPELVAYFDKLSNFINI